MCDFRGRNILLGSKKKSLPTDPNFEDHAIGNTHIFFLALPSNSYNTSLSPIQIGFAPGFVNYKTGCTRLPAASDKVYLLLSHVRWFSPGTPASSTTKTDCYDITEILLNVAFNTITNTQAINYMYYNLK